jgi:predicted nucleotidyltransferase
VAKTIRQLTPDELKLFDPTRNLRLSLDSQRWAEAWSQLPRLRQVLQEQFGATRVVLFGSLATKEHFTHWSDIDLAIWGVAPERFWEAIATLNDLSPNIRVDLVDAERCGAATLRKVIEQEGIEV